MSAPGFISPKHDWQVRHNAALEDPTRFERPIIYLVLGIRMYHLEHQIRYESKVGDDGVLGPAFLDIVRGFRVLLNGDCGRLDCGTLDGFAVDILRENGEEDTPQEEDTDGRADD